MKIEQAKKIMENAEKEIIEAYKTITQKQIMIFYENYEKELKEKQSQYDALNEQRKDLMGAKNFEDLHHMCNNIYDHGDTKDYIDPYISSASFSSQLKKGDK